MTREDGRAPSDRGQTRDDRPHRVTCSHDTSCLRATQIDNCKTLFFQKE
jgi:hypothetical protein